mmetsp:Transcript_23480/g.73512  ORF Transcript_23480/g.73512 Transcript_23480/m.73512 type:complete len:84 (-) Transcript_23480:216-467(-)
MLAMLCSALPAGSTVLFQNPFHGRRGEEKIAAASSILGFVCDHRKNELDVAVDTLGGEEVSHPAYHFETMFDGSDPQSVGQRQ